MTADIVTFDGPMPLEQLRKLPDAELVEYFQRKLIDHGADSPMGLRYMLYRGGDYIGDNDVVRLFAAFYVWVRPKAAEVAPAPAPDVIEREVWAAPKGDDSRGRI